MTGAIWMIMYDLDPTNSDRYLQWFDDVHIPEKLARPGYTWAAHYQILSDNDVPCSSYIALFGGTDSRVFYDPSPAQIKPLQTPETRSMMGYRSNSVMLILSEEWTTGGDDWVALAGSEVAAEKISFALFNAHDNDENLGAWLAQDYLVNLAGSRVTRKYIASTGVVRHIVVQELDGNETQQKFLGDTSASDWSKDVSNYITYPVVAPRLARRVWPVIG
ncbi:MAG: hypothetical protein ACI8P9_001051 [Parasphingorhabdus sp.]|jgi:hypothetical protein